MRRRPSKRDTSSVTPTAWPEAFGKVYDIVSVLADNELWTSLPRLPEAVIPKMPFDDDEEEEAPKGDDAEGGDATDPTVNNSTEGQTPEATPTEA